LHSNGLTTEQCKKSEVYSFALIMWSILTTQRPYAPQPHPPSSSTFVNAPFEEAVVSPTMPLDGSFQKLASRKVSFWNSFRRESDKVHTN
jgi:hypothetical protein